MPCRAVQYCAVLCRALPCCVLCCTLLCCTLTLSCMPVLFEVSYHVSVLLQHQVCTYYNMLNHNKCTPSSAQLYVAQQRGGVRCRAVPCLALQCGAVPCCAVLSVEHAPKSGIMRSTRYQVPVCTCCVLVFLLSSVACPLSVPIFFHPRKIHLYCRSERDIANKHTAQRTAQGN